jgi:hypothetical protein
VRRTARAVDVVGPVCDWAVDGDPASATPVVLGLDIFGEGAGRIRADNEVRCAPTQAVSRRGRGGISARAPCSFGRWALGAGVQRKLAAIGVFGVILCVATSAANRQGDGRLEARLRQCSGMSLERSVADRAGCSQLHQNQEPGIGPPPPNTSHPRWPWWYCP